MAKKYKEKIETSYTESLNIPVDSSVSVDVTESSKIKFVVKRDGVTKEKYNVKKIKKAISSAYMDVDQEVPDNIYRRFNYYLKKFEDKVENEEIKVEDIQDIVEYFLMKENPDVAKAYMIYRYDHKLMREKRTNLEKELEEKLLAKNIQNQNANVDEFSFGGRMGEANDVVTKQYALDHCVSRMARENHLGNLIYIHDLSAYAVGEHNCMSVPFDDLLKNGVKTRQCDIRPASSINTAFQLIAVYFQLQSLQEFGGVSATHLDWTMVPYVRLSFYKHFKKGMRYIEGESKEYVDKHYSKTKEEVREIEIDDEFYTRRNNAWKYAMEETEDEIMQAVEGLYHNLNTLQSRSGNQLPFSSINYGTCTKLAGRMIIKALIQGSLNGVGPHHKTPIFPCGIFQCMKGVNRKQGDPNYDLFKMALESTAKRIYPNYANCDWSGNAGYDINDPRTYFSTMGCRTANGWDINGFGQLKDGRGNICPTTIIMPTVAMETKLANKGKSEDDLVDIFLHNLDKKIEEAKDMLIERFNYIASQSPKSAKFMYENNVMAGYVPEEGIVSALKHGTLAVGQLGLAETLQILVKCDHTTKKGMKVAKRIEGLFKQRCAEYKEKYRLNFGVYYTPAENLCFTAMKKFKAKYGTIENVSDKDYFTNSMHVPVWHKITPFEKIDIESELTGYSSAGCITYVELPSGTSNNIEAMEELVNYAMDKDIPYFAINIPLDSCGECGYQGEIGETCPQCGSERIERLRRVTGYLTGDYKSAFNFGKQKETEDREKHKKEF